ncbi:MAG: hypothetical protein ACP5I9_10055 [Candidatus Kapaibacteriota bacterium]
MGNCGIGGGGKVATPSSTVKELHNFVIWVMVNYLVSQLLSKLMDNQSFVHQQGAHHKSQIFRLKGTVGTRIGTPIAIMIPVANEQDPVGLRAPLGLLLIFFVKLIN